MRSISQNLSTVHEHVDHAGRVLMRLIVRCEIMNSRRIEDHDVREISWLKATTFLDLEILRGLRCQSSNRLFHGNDFLVAHVSPEKSRDISVRARMRARLEKNT